MTKPTLIVFTHEEWASQSVPTKPKIFLRTLLYSTGKRGHVIENMFVKLHHDKGQWPFHVWGYGESKLVRGSGLFVGETGVAYNHHFLLGSSNFQYFGGQYRLEVFAATVGISKPRRLCSVKLTVPSEDRNVDLLNHSE